MSEYLNHILEGVSIHHLNLLLLLGLALFGGVLGGRLFQKCKIPQVVGYIIIGLIIGQSGLRLVDRDILILLQPFNYFALGLIGFMVGGELKREVFAKYGKQLVNILLCEGIAPFLLVSITVGLVGTFLLGDWRLATALALLMGAIASATDPASTTCVINEYRTRGPLTTTILGIVALDDGLALLLFVLASSIAGRLFGQTSEGLLITLIQPIYEIGGAIAIGLLSGKGLSKLLMHRIEKERMLAVSIGAILFVAGASLALKVDMLLAVMALGFIVVNSTPRKSKEIFKLVEGFTPPIYIIFFVLVGAKLNLRHATFPIIILIGIYLAGMVIGKMAGAYVGARISGAPKTVTKYLPFSLFSQAGVAIGLSILASHYFPGEIGNTLVIVITATTFLTQIIGPPLTKLALSKAGEIGLNITEEDLIEKTTIEDIMDKNPPLISENMPLTDILQVFSQTENLYYPVMNGDQRLKGIITVDNIKQTLMDTDVGGLILAHDLMQAVPATIRPNAPMLEAKELFDRYDLEYLPVVAEENQFVGFIEKKRFNKFISTKLMELQEHADSLG